MSKRESANILIVNPAFMLPPVFPVGLEYNAEALVRDGHAIEIVDLSQGTEPRYPASNGIDLIFVVVRNLDIGPGNVESALPQTRRLIADLRERYPTVPIAIAGAAINAVPEPMRGYLGADYALATKGHNAARALLRHVLGGETAGPRVFEDYSDTIDGVYERPYVEKSKYKEHPIGIATHFGCPFRCQYCNYPAVEGFRITSRSPADIVAEIRNLQRQGVERVFFCDSVFNVPVKHATALLRAMIDANLDVEWDGFFNPHPNAFTSEFVDVAMAAGRKRFHFGVDSLADPVLSAIHKGYTVADVQRAVDMCHERGAPVSCSLLFGHPSETVETVRQSFQACEWMGYDAVDVTERVRIYPRTELAQIAINEGVISDSPDELLFPTFYPVSDAVLAEVAEQTALRAYCREPGVDQYIYST
ncbi:MAG: B12-binding domain-containing radical SAM protein [Thermoanaerobaculia bacterium]